MDTIIFFLLLIRSSADSFFDNTRTEIGGGIAVSPLVILNVLVLGLMMYVLIAKRGSLFAVKLWLPFLLVTLMSIGWTTERAGAIRLFLYFLTYMSFLLLPFFMKPSHQDHAWLLKAIILSAIFPMIYAFIEFVAFPDEEGRIQATFSHPNIFAFYLVIIIGAVLFVRSSSVLEFRPWSAALTMPFTAALFVLLILTQTRAAWVGGALILMTYAAAVDRRYLSILVLLPGLLFVHSVSERLSDLWQGTEYTGQMRSEADVLNSYAWRKLMWQSALKDAEDVPVLGKGLASLKPNSPRFFPLPLASEEGMDAHSAYVQAIYENGYVGLACYLFLYLAVLWRAWAGRKVDKRGALVVCSIIIAHSLASYSDNVYYYLAMNWYFWGFLGIVFAKWDRVAQTVATSRQAAEEQPHVAEELSYSIRQGSI